MSRRVSLRLVTGRAVEEEPEALADDGQVLDEGLDEPEGQPPALGVTPAAAASG
jgi:hypothetical protein